jgi:hypothetical protein
MVGQMARFDQLDQKQSDRSVQQNVDKGKCFSGDMGLSSRIQKDRWGNASRLNDSILAGLYNRGKAIGVCYGSRDSFPLFHSLARIHFYNY